MFQMAEHRNNHKKGTLPNKRKTMDYGEKHALLQRITFTPRPSIPNTAADESRLGETVIQQKGVVPLSTYCSKSVSPIPADLATLVSRYDDHDFSLEEFTLIAKIDPQVTDPKQEFERFKQFVQTGYDKKRRLPELFDIISSPMSQGTLNEVFSAMRQKKDAQSEINAIYLDEQQEPYAPILKALELYLLGLMNSIIQTSKKPISEQLVFGILHELSLVNSQISSFPDPIPDPFSHFSSSSTLRQYLPESSPLRQSEGSNFFTKLSDETTSILEAALNSGLTKTMESDYVRTYNSSQTNIMLNFTQLRQNFENLIIEQTELAHYTSFGANMPILMSHDALEKSRIPLRQTNTSSKVDAKPTEYVSKSQPFDVDLRDTDFVFFFLDLKGSNIKRTFGRYRYSIPFNEADEAIMALLDDLSAPYDRWNRNESDSPTDLSLRSKLKYTIHYDPEKKELTHHQLSAEDSASPSHPPTLKVPPLQTVLYGKSRIAKTIALRGAIHIKMLLEAGNINFVSDILSNQKKMAEFITSIMKVQIMVPRFAMPKAFTDMGTEWCPARR